MSRDRPSGAPAPLSDLLFDRGIMRRSAIVAAIVGTILTGINQGDLILGGAMPVWWKMALTYCVPYCVATYGAVTARQAAQRKQASAGPER